MPGEEIFGARLHIRILGAHPFTLRHWFNSRFNQSSFDGVASGMRRLPSEQIAQNGVSKFRRRFDHIPATEGPVESA